MSALKQDTDKIDNANEEFTFLEPNPTQDSEKEPQDSSCDRTVRSQPLLHLNSSRQEVLAYFKNTWGLTETLFSGLVSEEAFYRRPYHKTRHPLIFYYAHPVCFYVNKLLVSGIIDHPVNAEYELLFETGVDEMNWDDLHDGEQDIWPALADVKSYRHQVYKLLCHVIETHPAFAQPITMASPAWAVVMGFEHERIHLETSSVLIRELPIELVQTPSSWPQSATGVKTARDLSNEDKTDSGERSHEPILERDYPNNSQLVNVAATQVTLGKPIAWPSFGWDNEYGSEQREVASFRASPFLVSNGEFFQFVKERGYETERFWTSTSWAWRRFRNVKWPTFWVQDGPAGLNRFRLRLTFAEIAMQWDWPAVVNFYEAKAYCSWLTEKQRASDPASAPFRLLSEAEHNAIRQNSQQAITEWKSHQNNLSGNDEGSIDEVMNSVVTTNLCNHNLQFGSESPVNHFPANKHGFHDVFGNVWQWCEDAFHPLPGFEIHPYYSDFSTPCFDGEHQMILGGSFISTGDEASIWSRFHFRPHFFQHSGFRVVQSTADGAEGFQQDKYESDELVNQYLLFHFGTEQEQRDEAISDNLGHPPVGNLINRTVELVEQFSLRKESVLDLGCAVGRASFELSRGFEEVVGIDYSEAFVAVAKQLQSAQQMTYRRRETGRHFTELQARVSEFCRRDRTYFCRGDAANLNALNLRQSNGRAFDAILLSNLLCRLSDPAACLKQFVESDKYLAAGGILVIASPNTWMEQFTTVENFLDGGDSNATMAAIGSNLPGFECIHMEDLSFMIREHRRKYEYIVSQLTVWRKL